MERQMVLTCERDMAIFAGWRVACGWRRPLALRVMRGAILAFGLPWKITNFPIMSQCQRIAIGLGSECVYVAGGGSGRSGQCVSA